MFKYPTWLKRLLLPFEFEDHPLYSNPDAEDESDTMIRELLGDEFADRMNNF